MNESIRYQIISEETMGSVLNKELTRFLIRLFPEWASIFAKQRAWHEARPVWTTLAFASDGSGNADEKNETIVGHVAVVERTITTDWNFRYRVASIQGVSVDPAWRRRGIGRQLLSLTLEEARRRQYPFAILFCKEPLVPYYQLLGWRLPEDSMIMWKDRALPIPMRSNCPMFQTLSTLEFPEGPIDVHNPFGFSVLDEVGPSDKQQG